jgi:hypothetical protein
LVLFPIAALLDESMQTIEPVTVRTYRSLNGQERRNVYYATQYRSSEQIWIPLPFDDEQAQAVTFVGNGKHAMLFLEFDEHRGMALSVHDLTVIPEGGVQIHTMPYGDTKVLIRYSGNGLRLRAMRLGFDPSYGSRATCQQLVQSWLSSGEDEDLGAVVEVEMTLVAGVRDGTPR